MAAITRREYSGDAPQTTLSSDISNSATSIPVTDGTGYPTGADPFYIVIGRGTSSEEKILCSSRTGNTITASSRGADDTSATSHDAGATVEHVWTAQDADDVNKVAAALTTKGDLLVFGTEPTRLPVGADDTVLVADSSDAAGAAWKDADAVSAIVAPELHAVYEVENSAEDASYSLTGSVATFVSLTLTIPAEWGGWSCKVDLDGFLSVVNDTLAADLRIVVDGNNQTTKSISLSADGDSDVARHAHVTGLTSTGSVTIAAQIGRTAGSGGTIVNSFLYARAVRTS